MGDLRESITTLRDLIARATHEQDARQFAKAEETYRKILEIAPGWAEVHNNLGTTLCEQGKFKEAVDCYERGLALKPDVAKVHYNPGKVLKDMGYLTDPQRDTNSTGT